MLAPSDDADDLPIGIDDGANVLDHSVLLGVSPRSARRDLHAGPKRTRLAATSISTGASAARLLLGFGGDVEDGSEASGGGPGARLRPWRRTGTRPSSTPSTRLPRVRCLSPRRRPWAAPVTLPGVLRGGPWRGSCTARAAGRPVSGEAVRYRRLRDRRRALLRRLAPPGLHDGARERRRRRARRGAGHVLRGNGTAALGAGVDRTAFFYDALLEFDLRIDSSPPRAHATHVPPWKTWSSNSRQ